MKFGLRTPSPKRSFKARTTGKVKRKIKRTVNPFYGKKGMGFIRNPKKAVYNKVYHRTTFGISDLFKNSSGKKQKVAANNTNADINTDVNQNSVDVGSVKQSKNKWVLLALCFFLVIVGVHKLYEGNVNKRIPSIAQEVEISEMSRKETVENVSFNVPDNWTRKDTNGTTYFYTPDGDSLYYCSTFFDVDFVDVEESYMQGITYALKKTVTSVEVIEEEHPHFYIDGDYNNMFFRRHIKFTDNKNDYVMTVYVTQKGDNIYQFLMTAQGDEAVYDDAIMGLVLETFKVNE